jgi:hypothetical protein
MTAPTTLRGPALRRFVRHYLEIVVATVVGMVVLGPAESMLLNPIGWAGLLANFETYALVMATNMTVAMAAWMRFRRHSWAAIAEMAVLVQASARVSRVGQGRTGACAIRDGQISLIPRALFRVTGDRCAGNRPPRG